VELLTPGERMPDLLPWAMDCRGASNKPSLDPVIIASCIVNKQTNKQTNHTQETKINASTTPNRQTTNKQHETHKHTNKTNKKASKQTKKTQLRNKTQKHNQTS
jgi:hypothetical protein